MVTQILVKFNNFEIDLRLITDYYLDLPPLAKMHIVVFVLLFGLYLFRGWIYKDIYEFASPRHIISPRRVRPNQNLFPPSIL